MNPHDEMDMRQSVQVIISHVEKGVFLAQKSGIPKQITDFIKTHHGTKRTEYFYRLFKNENPDADGGNIFNYPGPVPSSREEALVMMADAVEAASRSLKFPDKDAIRKLVNEVVDSQIEQNQFVNADITMRDISRVKSVFIHRLVNIFHVRLSYPS
jgi:membrane-associated HD superfamily phosphohydrolase